MYVCNGHYKSLVTVMIFFLKPLTFFVFILYMSVGDLQFEVDCDKQSFEKIFLTILFTFSVEKYYYENGNDVIKMINKSSKNTKIIQKIIMFT